MFGFLVLTAMIFAANCAKTKSLTKSCDSDRVVCSCNVNHDSQVSESIKKLETKMESLIALVNNTSTPKPNPPGISTNVRKNFIGTFCHVCICYFHLTGILRSFQAFQLLLVRNSTTNTSNFLHPNKWNIARLLRQKMKQKIHFPKYSIQDACNKL